MKFSVLMSIYKNEKPQFLDESLKSILNQSLSPDEIVIVEDGSLTEELSEVLLSYMNKYSDIIKTIPLPQNVGLGQALAIGVEACTYDIIARMDTDDIARKDRFEKQISFLKENPGIDVLGSFISEFETSPENIYAERILPIVHDKIYTFAKFRSPMNHMTVVFKKAAVLGAGNYSDLKKMQDFELWGRMLNKGYKFANIPENLVNARGGSLLMQKRNGFKYFLDYEFKIQKSFFDSGFINTKEFLRNVTSKLLLRIIPEFLRQFIYKNYLRNKPKKI